MFGKRIVLLAAAAALPLTVVGAGTAGATEKHASTDYPSVHIKNVRYNDHDYFNVKVKYRCYSEDHYNDEDGSLYVSVTQRHDSYEGWDHEAKCDGYWHHKWVAAYNNDDVEFRNGKLRVDAEVTDHDGHQDSDYKIYRITFDHHY